MVPHHKQKDSDGRSVHSGIKRDSSDAATPENNDQNHHYGNGKTAHLDARHDVAKILDRLPDHLPHMLDRMGAQIPRHGTPTRHGHNQTPHQNNHRGRHSKQHPVQQPSSRPGKKRMPDSQGNVYVHVQNVGSRGREVKHGDNPEHRPGWQQNLTQGAAPKQTRHQTERDRKNNEKDKHKSHRKKDK